jgi:hypothetical protein
MVVFLRRTSAIVTLCLLPCAASAQTWRDALKKGDDQTAAALLQPLVVQSLLPLMSISTDPEPARQLALMYAQGLGVPVDAVMACGLTQSVKGIIEREPGPLNYDFTAWQARVKEADALVHVRCDRLSEEDRSLAGRILCFTFGMPDEVMMLGSEAIRVDRAGIRLASDEGRRFEAPVNCPQLIARVRPLTMEPPADAAPGVKPRYFVDVLGWSAGPGSYSLGWQLYELRNKKLELVVILELISSDSWPMPALPKDFDSRFTIEMIRTGHVHWKMDGAPPKRGWVMLPEKER